MKKNPLVSVIIPAYNASKYIERTILSVVNQTYDNVEILVVDDCSTDHTGSIVKSLAHSHNNLFYLKLEKNAGGPAIPRNFGIQRANGKYLAFLDADDIWHSDKLCVQISELIKSPYKAVCARSIDFNNEDSIQPCNTDRYNVSKISYSQVKFKSLIPLSTLIVDSDFLGDITFNNDKRVVGREDYLFTLDFLKQHKYILKIELPLMFYRKHCDQISKNKIVMLRRQYDVLSKHLSTDSLKANKMRIALYLLTHVVLSLYYRVLLKRL